MSTEEQEPQAAPADEPDAPQEDTETPAEGDPTSNPPDTGPLEIPTPIGEPDESAITGPTTIEGDDDDLGDPDAPAETDAPQGRSLTEKDLQIRDQKLDRERQRHASRLGEIMGEDANDLIPCPVCMDEIDGWIYPPDVKQLSPEAISRIRTVIGLPDYTTFRQAPDAQECPDCGGLGETITGSHVPGFETKTCSRCQKQGWILVGKPGNGHVHVADVPTETGPQVYQNDESNDPEIQHLRERGFTVIPPMALTRS